MNNLSEYPIPFSQTKYLCLSSLMFLIPGFISYYFGFIIYSLLSISNAIFSINHWRRAEDGIRRKLDVFIARLSFIVYFSSGLFYLQNITSLLTITLISSSYFISKRLSLKHNSYWVIAHFIFHISVSSTKILIIYAMHKTPDYLCYA